MIVFFNNSGWTVKGERKMYWLTGFLGHMTAVAPFLLGYGTDTAALSGLGAIGDRFLGEKTSDGYI